MKRVRNLLLIIVVFGFGLGVGILVQKKYFESDKYKGDQAIRILDSVPEIKSMMRQAGVFMMPYAANEVITVDLRDNSNGVTASRLETFDVNLNTKEVSVWNIVNGSTMSLTEWRLQRQKYFGH